MDKNNTQPLVSIITPVYNGEEYLPKTVASLLGQDYENIELILVNDGSSDGSARLLESLRNQDPRIKVFHQENAGVGATRNFAVSQACGDFLAFCDQDDIWHQTKLSKQVPLFGNPKVGLVYCGALSEYVQRNSVHRPSFEDKHRGDVFEHLIRLNMLTCCTAVVRKSLFDYVGGFDESMELMGVDDWHLWLKISLFSEFDFVEEHLATHVFHGTNFSQNDLLMYRAELECLDKIQKYLDELRLHKNIPWSKIKFASSIRYGKSFVYSGLYNLAGETFIQADQWVPSPRHRWLGRILKFVPDFLLRLGQKSRRFLTRQVNG
ncbi:glycosyltransferase family 2 protein [Thalassotalea mangrovi]|uniref:Glycosyltransferase n=1 Tax=Thalassotalea mangrovi TaxID=2572245 RepID=A0A4U1B9W1_9GAMM|nr:glycosyltransferase [Thalassotalea mangrovi]TKB47444.1 glycosyltransferase [Thalassotalea mangrovi]